MNSKVRDIDVALDCLRATRHATSSILTNIKLVLNNFAYSSRRDPGRPLREMLRTELEAFSERSKLKRTVTGKGATISFQVDEQLPLLSQRVAMAIAWMMDHAMVNALEHAEAENIHVLVGCYGEELQLIVRDDGRGFTPDAERKRSGEHHGLQFMVDRTESIGGSLTVSSGDDGQIGTTVHISVPL